MKFLRDFLVVALLACLAAASIVGMMVQFPLEAAMFSPIRNAGNWVLKVVVPKPSIFFWFWFGMLSGTFAALFLAIGARRKRASIEVKLDDGRVVILETAIRKYLKNTLADVSGFLLQKIDIYRVRRGLHVDVYAQVRAQQKLPDLETRVIQRVKMALTRDLGISEIAAVQVFVRDFKIDEEPALSFRKSPERSYEVEEEPRPLEAPKEGAAQFKPFEPAERDDTGTSPLSTLDKIWSQEEPEAAAVEPAASDPDTESVDSAPAPTPRKSFFSRWRKEKEAPADLLTNVVEPAGPGTDESFPTTDEPAGDNAIVQPSTDEDGEPPSENK
jgi:uncharacterized alkaline shock family protein YloU